MKKSILILLVVSCIFSCKNKDRAGGPVPSIRQATIDSIEYANKQQRRIDSLEALTRQMPALITEGPAMVPLTDAPKKTKRTVPAKNVPHKNDNTRVTNSSTVTPASGTAVTTPEKKKGLNNAAKGAIIGLGTGAAAGAIIGKDNRGKGAVVGGVIGAIGGAVGGAVIDKRKAKKQAERDSLRKDSIRNHK